VLKIHSRCDLACDYCYVYAMADQSWQDQPRRMPTDIVKHAAFRIAEHASDHRLDEISLVLHGGEPLLAGPGFIAEVIATMRDMVGPTVAIRPYIQTNGVRLDEQFLALFSELGVGVGVSVDGDQVAQDLHRRFASGRGSHAQVTAGLALLAGSRYQHLFSGLLCVIDPRNDPLTTYGALLAWGPPKIDFLLPHGTWDSPPPGRRTNSVETPYADWLIPIFDDWYREPRTHIRLFAEIIRSQLGGTSGAESVGLAPASVIVIEANGAVEQVDTMKAAFHGAPRTGLHVSRDPLDAVLRMPEIVFQQMGIRGLCEECQKCRIRRVCGGGLYAHRYRSGQGFLTRPFTVPT
jgi:uncharacterized protein